MHSALRRLTQPAETAAPAELATALLEFSGQLFVAVRYGPWQTSDDRAILRAYTQGAGTWETRHEATQLTFPSGSPEWRARALRRRAQGRSMFSLPPVEDGISHMLAMRVGALRKPLLFAATSGNDGPGFLASSNGTEFRQGLPFGVAGITRLAGLVLCSGRLFACPEGPAPAPLYTNGDPFKQAWTPVEIPGFAETGNRAISAIGCLNKRLYLGTENRETGPQIWLSEPIQKPVQRLHAEPLISGSNAAWQGYDRIESMTVADDRILVGTRSYDLASAADATARTGAGLLALSATEPPLPLVGPAPTMEQDPGEVAGLGDAGNRAVSAIAVHRNRLYVGTRNFGGFQLWVQPQSGGRFECLFTEGAGDRTATEVTALRSTQWGLVMATKRFDGFDVWLIEAS